MQLQKVPLGQLAKGMNRSELYLHPNSHLKEGEQRRAMRQNYLFLITFPSG